MTGQGILSLSLCRAEDYKNAVNNGRLVYLMPNGNAGSFADLPAGERVICVGFYDEEGDFVQALFDFGRKAP